MDNTFARCHNIFFVFYGSFNLNMVFLCNLKVNAIENKLGDMEDAGCGWVKQTQSGTLLKLKVCCFCFFLFLSQSGLANLVANS